ncbi:hypothetical protein LTS10_008118 [Elasticomyces elasticus]|nr:hypothetical protein LTS10_008118 [Elasticomyces elasticus]
MPGLDPTTLAFSTQKGRDLHAAIPQWPTGVVLSTLTLNADSSTFTISFTAPADAKAVKVALYHGGFVTHAVHMSQRMVFLGTNGWRVGATKQTITVTGPPNNNVAPPGPYVVYLVVDGVPGVGQFVTVS